MHSLREAPKRGNDHADRPLWPWSRMTAWRQVKAVIAAGVPLNMLSKWMGHATLETTAIYARSAVTG